MSPADIALGDIVAVNIGGKKVSARVIEIRADGRARLCYTQKNVERIIVRSLAFLEKPPQEGTT